MDCQMCNGNGDVECYKCSSHNGASMGGEDHSDGLCDHCYGTGVVSCYHCFGKGSLD
ncbi:hypothetical protein SAMN05421736_104156 [Evansella caseinilytica]|uniref:Uncharacterized protein n=1 Tax=Evansella caseinilytica TaxID=1503961 RepID=A0A1H3NPK7_9BACI|nr:hypothetical protein [Evansella caseinilytica]SDY90832.1 hypothetical protein SAMN05421736_104156 [Evansella caseinilytica]